MIRIAITPAAYAAIAATLALALAQDAAILASIALEFGAPGTI